ncbi:unnamed protein product [Calicophoron daubneyi]|uniref:Uncharacterized protein n=1 Tax=Calicophoron daubneyi TaxID=300641 RepID=A0AAV2TNE3_CALDB
MLQPEVYLTKSATEVLRTVSVVTGKDIVPANFFKKPDQMDDVLGHLIALYFDSPSVPSRRGELLCLANTIVTELKIPINIRVEDFSDERDRKKWLTFFSHVIRFLEDSTKFEPGVALYAEVTKAKIKYAELLEAVKNKEEEIGLRQGERQAKQKVVDQLGDVVSHLSEKLRQLKANRSSLEKEVNALRSRKSRAVENIQRLVPEVENLMEECDKTNAMILQDIDKLPSSIASLKEDLFAVEAEMHSLFEKRTSIVDRTSTFQHYESMLEQLKSSVNQINILMREFSEAKKEEEVLMFSLPRRNMMTQQMNITGSARR